MARPILFKRLPTWKARIAPDDERHIMSPEQQREYPQFAADFALLDEHLIPVYRELDATALRAQNDFRMEQLILIVGSLAATILAGLHMAYGLDAVGNADTALPIEGGWAWAGALVSAVVTAVTARAKDLRNQDVYRSTRLKAETLRSEYFLFLGRVGEYAKQTREGYLMRRVAQIQGGSGTNG